MSPHDVCAGLTVSRETLDHFKAFEDLVTKWNPRINLISKASTADIFQRHIADSAQLFNLAVGETSIWCDLGSGGGFPGIVVGILSKTTARPGRIILVESDKRKAVFLREVARQLEINVEVINDRIEAVPSIGADIVSARALAPLTKLCAFAERHSQDNGISIFPKGASHKVEIDEARRSWKFDLEAHQSLTDASSAILLLRNIRHA